MNYFRELISTLINFEKLVNYINNLPIEISWLVFLLFCFISILIFLKLFGENGIYVYTSIAIVVANIQLVKIVQFSFFIDPIPLGTALFASTFLCTDILAEYYDSSKAKKNVYIGLASFLLVTLFMIFTLGFKPIENQIQNSLKLIFLPLPIFFIASMIAYLSSQLFDVWFFTKISILTNKNYLWFRNNFSTIISSLLDNIIFSIFAWIILNPNPENLKTVTGFIFGTYILRIFIAFIDTPFIYIAKYLIKK